MPIEVGAAAKTIDQQRSAISSFEPIAPDVLPRTIQTQAAYQQLVSNGFSGPDAAGLISYVVGLAPCGTRWSLAQINRLLFLRELYSNSHWGEVERRPA